MQTHQMILTVSTDDRFSSEPQRQMLRDMIGDRVWRIDGVKHGSVIVNPIGTNKVLLDRVEYERLKSFEREATGARP